MTTSMDDLLRRITQHSCDDGGADDLLPRITQHSCDDNFVDDDFQSMTLREAVIHVSGHREVSSGTVIT